MSADRFEIIDDGRLTIAIRNGANTLYIDELEDEFAVAAIRQQARDIAALKDALAGEVTANKAFRKSGGARDDEDMPTFCARLIAERDAYKHDALALMKINTGAIQALEQTERERDQLRAELAEAIAERGRLLDSDAYSRKELARGNEIIDGLRIERDTLRARLAAIEAAPTVAIAVHVYTDRGPYKYLNFAEHDIPASGVELIARPEKD